MKTTTVNISFPSKLLHKIDEAAEQEARSRSDLLREAVRKYLEEKERWEDIFTFGRKTAINLKLKERDIQGEIRKYRKAA